ncbi:MAG: DNA-directed RNA polymerase subunit omega [Armatimonadetes bacterium]|nr:DNA-directed RNA polymerase subunit omega [Armatimonadota bacterium]MDW8029456.1 DNA-directed RNA polymerase subunit omega [Armatimonadota bacterium]
MEQGRELNVPLSVLLNDLQYQINNLPEAIRSKHLLVLAVAERARQIVESHERDQSEENPVTRALKEIVEGRFQLRVNDERFLRALQGKPEETDIFPYRP